MARVTTEDCTTSIPNRFQLVIYACNRARDLSSGSQAEVSIDNDITGRGDLLFLGFNLTRNSADKCSASAAEPPLPQIKIFFLSLRHFERIPITFLIFFFLIDYIV